MHFIIAEILKINMLNMDLRVPSKAGKVDLGSEYWEKIG